MKIHEYQGKELLKKFGVTVPRGKIDRKMAAIRANKTMVGNMVRHFRDELSDRKLKLPELEGKPEAAIAAYADLRFKTAFAARGQEHGLRYAERFHYIGPDTSLDDYVARHAVRLG